MRWMFKFTGYEYTFKYKPGKLNCNADALSRNPIDEPSKEDINKNLPHIKIMMLKRDEKNSRKLETTKPLEAGGGEPEAGYNQLRIHKIHQLNVTPVSSSESDGDTTLSKQEATDTARRFKESLRSHESKARIEDSEEEEELDLPSHFSDGDKVPEGVREFLDELDPFDPVNRKDDVISQRI